MIHKYDTILHEVRRFFGLTHVEYCIMNTIAGLSLSQNWCSLTNKQLAETQDVSAIYVGQVCSKLFNLGLIITQSAIGKTSLKKATNIWNDAIILAKKNLKSTDEPENKVYRSDQNTPKQSMHTPKQSIEVPNNFVITSSKQSMHSYKNNEEEDKEEKEREKEAPQNPLSLCFDFFKTVSDAFFTSGCTKKEPTKYKRNFAALVNIALGLSDSPSLNEKGVLQYNAAESEIIAINGEIRALQASMDYFSKVRENAVKNSKDGYIPRLLEKIIKNEEYKQPQTTPANAKRDLDTPKSELLRIGLSQSDIDEMMSSKVRSFEAAKSVFIGAFRAGRVQPTTENLELFTRCIKQLRPTL